MMAKNKKNNNKITNSAPDKWCNSTTNQIQTMVQWSKRLGIVSGMELSIAVLANSRYWTSYNFPPVFNKKIELR